MVPAARVYNADPDQDLKVARKGNPRVETEEYLQTGLSYHVFSGRGLAA